MSEEFNNRNIFSNQDGAWPSDEDFRNYSEPQGDEIDVFGMFGITRIVAITRHLPQDRGIQLLVPVVAFEVDHCPDCNAEIQEVRIGSQVFNVDIERRGPFVCANLISEHDCSETQVQP